MVCCDVCESWSHLSCMGMKEGVGILEGKKFVCHFCPSACVMELRWEVKGLREELDVVTDKLRVTSEENEKLCLKEFILAAAEKWRYFRPLAIATIIKPSHYAHCLMLLQCVYTELLVYYLLLN